MKWFSDLKITVKILTVLGVVTLISAIVGIVGVVNINKIVTADKEMYENATVPLSNAGRISSTFQQIRTIERDMIISNNPVEINALAEKNTDLSGQIGTLIEEYKKTIKNDEEQKGYDDYVEARKECVGNLQQLTELAKANKDLEAIALLNSEAYRRAENAYVNALNNFFESQVNEAKDYSKNNVAAGKSSETTMVIFIILGIAAAAGLAIFVSRMISIPIKKIAEAAGRLAKGDMDVEVEASTKDEIGDLNFAFEAMIKAIKTVDNDINTLSAAAIEGKLDVRADISKHNGEFAKIVDGVNKTLDAVIKPLKEAHGALEKMVLNDYTFEMTGEYQGVLKDFAASIIGVRGRLLSLLDTAERVAKGDISRLEEFHKIGKRSENDRLMPAFTTMMENIDSLIKEAGMLANAATNGDLSIRGNADKFEGGYKQIIEGINKTLDGVVEPIEEASVVMSEMAKGNLTVSMDGEYKGEYEKMKASINNTIIALNEMFRELNASSEQVAAGARHISDSSQALSQGSSEQASSVEEITTAITQIAAQTKQNAINATQANDLANTAKDNAVQGNEQMKEMLIAMYGINESSANISKIIKVIDDIAFQTNILALNAAVEAARAGQHGKGFAVVAEEVRNLAARSANAAKETTDMIEGSIKKVEAGTNIANHTAEALNVIVEDVTKAASIVSQIAIASNEQATGITQINQGIAQVSQVTQTNTATAEESASASEELSGQAQLLKDMVSRFKLKNSASSTGEYKASYSETASSTEYKSSDSKKSNTRKVKISLDDKEFGKY